MRKIYTIFLAVTLTASVFAQAPQKMSYQAVVRNTSGNLVVNSPVGMRIQILQTSEFGAAVYVETHSATTNSNGLVTLEIGSGTVVFGTFAGINWANGPYFIKTETDPAGGVNYTAIVGISQLLSVPYALYAKTIAGFSETDPIFVAWNRSSGISITTSQVSDFQTSVTNNAAVLANTLKNSYPLADQTKLAAITGTNTGDQTLSGLGGVASNAPITGATKTKITYDAKGLVISGADATTSDIAASTDKNYVTNAQLTVLNNTSGTNTGNQNLASVLTQGTDAGNNKILNVNQQGIGTATPDASSALEISSTTQGFLPPRMTQAQRDAITPVNGLMVYNTGTKRPNYYDENEWKNFDGTSAKTLTVTIGDNYQGGKVAYILQSGDPGYVAGETHGLIAATSDQSTGIQWYNGTNTNTGAYATALGTGNSNTMTIIASQGNTGSYAAKLCADLVLAGYSDWYLPSRDELNKLYLNRVAIGGFASASYFSSSETNISAVWSQDFTNGSQNYGNKFSLWLVRAVRSF